MELLYFLESIRNSILDFFFLAVTTLGEEVLFIVVGLIFLWCVNKKEGYYLLIMGLFGTVINQFLKIAFRIPRPWVIDSKFTVVEGAKEAATGYSFPSGHTQVGVGMYGGLARWNKNKWARIITIIIAVLIPLSRMYLGVHTPLDVGVSILIALALIFVLHPIINSEKQSYMHILFGVILLIGVGFLCYVNFYNFPQETDFSEIAHSLENACKMLGCVSGVWLSYAVDTRFIKYETKAKLFKQILKVFIGILPIIAIKTFLKEPLYMLVGNQNIADFIRYFLFTVFGGCVWPLTFKFFSKNK